MKKLELTENQIQNQVLSWLKMHEIFAFIVRSVGTYDAKIKGFRAAGPWFRKGCPDILICYKGKFVGLEIKTKKGVLSEHQESFHKDIWDNGGYVYVVRDAGDLRAIFDFLDKEPNSP